LLRRQPLYPLSYENIKPSFCRLLRSRKGEQGPKTSLTK
jgi:hypothetical protein